MSRVSYRISKGCVLITMSESEYSKFALDLAKQHARFYVQTALDGVEVSIPMSDYVMYTFSNLFPSNYIKDDPRV